MKAHLFFHKNYFTKAIFFVVEKNTFFLQVTYLTFYTINNSQAINTKHHTGAQYVVRFKCI